MPSRRWWRRPRGDEFAALSSEFVVPKALQLSLIIPD